MKLLKYLILLSAFISMSSFAGGFRQISIGSGQLPEQVQSQNLNYVPGNPVTVSGQLTVPNGQTVNELQLTVDVDGYSPEVTSLSVSYGPGSHSFTINSGAVAAGNASISIKALSGTTVLFSNTYGQSASIPDQIGTLLNDPDLITSNLDIASSDLVGVLDSVNPIDSDILSNLADLNAEIDENDHGCSVPSASATAAEGRTYLICVMEAHYTDEVNAAFASFTAPNPATLEVCNTNELCAPAPSICDESIFTCTITPTNFPVADGSSVTGGYSGTDDDPVNFANVDTSSQIGSASYTVSVALTSYPNGIASSANNSFDYTSLQYSDDVYTAVSVTSSSLAAQTVNQLSEISIDASTVFSFVNSENSIDYSIATTGGAAAPMWLSIDEDTGEITGNPPITASSSYSLVVTGTDPQGATASATLPLTVSGLSADQLANYSSVPVRDGTTDVYLKIPTDQNAFSQWGSSVTTSSDSNAVTAYFHFNSPEASGGSDRLSVSQVISALGASNLSDGDSSLGGLEDANGNLITLASSDGDSGGYAIIAVNQRQNSSSAYQHGILQLIPLSSGTTTSIASNSSTTVYPNTKPYGFVADTASDVSGTLALSGGTVGDTISVDFTALNEPDGSFDDFDIAYQWYLDGTAIPGATSSTYDGLSYANAGSALTVNISYTDNAYYNESITSASQSVVLPSSGTAINSTTTPVTAVDLAIANVSSSVISDLVDNNDCGPARDESCLDHYNDALDDSSLDLSSCNINGDKTEYVNCVIAEADSAIVDAIADFHTDAELAAAAPVASTLSGTTSCSVSLNMPVPLYCLTSRWNCSVHSVTTGITASYSQGDSAVVMSGHAAGPAKTFAYTMRMDNASRPPGSHRWSKKYSVSVSATTATTRTRDSSTSTLSGWGERYDAIAMSNCLTQGKELAQESDMNGININSGRWAFARLSDTLQRLRNGQCDTSNAQSYVRSRLNGSASSGSNTTSNSAPWNNEKYRYKFRNADGTQNNGAGCKGGANWSENIQYRCVTVTPSCP